MDRVVDRVKMFNNPVQTRSMHPVQANCPKAQGNVNLWTGLLYFLIKVKV